MALTDQQVKDLQGLTDQEVTDRIKKYGYNELPSAKKRGIIHIAFEVIKEPMFLLLVACGLLYLFTGDYQEAIMLLGFVFVMMGITIYQEGKTEKALDALKDLSSPRALVIRDNDRIRIAGREVVKDDIMILSEGDRVPADAVLLWGINLSTDESLLTGESVPVRKSSRDWNMEIGKPGGDDTPFLFSGTLVVQGQGVAVVKSTGISTQLGKIGKELQAITQEETLLQKETKKIVKTVFVAALFLCIAIVLFIGLAPRGNLSLIDQWKKGFLSGITLAMAMLPEEFPVVLTIFLALGAWRISQKKVLTRKMTAIETLGASTILCVDKTGTLTQNKMTIKTLYTNGIFYDIKENINKKLPEDFHELVEYGILASQKDPFDPMEKALKNLGDKKLSNTEHLHNNWKLIHQYPLSKELLALSHVWESPNGKQYIISAKGAPESIADLCHLNKNQIDEISEKVRIMAGEGLRVLGVAQSAFNKATLPKIQHDFKFNFLGLIGLEDPIRETVPIAVKECYQAGIRVVMITGDYPLTAHNIGKQIGLKDITEIITGADLEKMKPEELQEKIKNVNIFARVVPEQKLFIVNALKANGEIVAMTGDGVNDAPALKSANIGVAMGERGTDVAREASDLVLLDDSFPSIVEAVKQGRRIFDNLRKAMAYIISVHVPIAGASLLPIILKLPEILFPVHIVFLELIIDPACSVVFEAEKEEDDIMRRKPRKSKEPLFSKKTLVLSLLQGIFSLLVVLGVYKISLYFGQKIEEARTLSFATLIISNLCLILTNRSWSNTIFSSFKKKNAALVWVIIGALIFLGLVIYIPFLQNLFHFTSISPFDILIAFGGGILSVIWFELVKLISRKNKIELMNSSSINNK